MNEPSVWARQMLQPYTMISLCELWASPQTAFPGWRYLQVSASRSAANNISYKSTQHFSGCRDTLDSWSFMFAVAELHTCVFRAFFFFCRHTHTVLTTLNLFLKCHVKVSSCCGTDPVLGCQVLQRHQNPELPAGWRAGIDRTGLKHTGR